MSKNLFSDFQPVSKEQWKSRIIKDLKGKDYNESLRWTSDEGIVVEPFYHAEDLAKLIEEYHVPLNLHTRSDNSWLVMEKISVEDAQTANQKALTLLNQGAETIEFDGKGQVLTSSMVEQLIKGILTDAAPVSLSNFKGAHEIKLSQNVILKQDVISEYLNTNQPIELKQWHEDHQHLRATYLYIDGAVYQNAGAKMVHQLAVVLGVANEYLAQWSASDVEQLKNIHLKLAVGSNFFFEIAKLRAIRKLLQVLLSAYTNNDVSIHLQVESTGINKSTLDSYNNMLRNTGECMSAIIGGADIVHINAHDYLTEQTEKGKRWARNISHILRNESHFDKVNDPTNGSYYVEELTAELSEKAWEVFKQLEAEGGFLKAWEKGMVQEMIQADRSAQIEAFKSGKKVLLGVNKYGPANLTWKDLPTPTHPLSPLRLAALLE